jgi:hypothetical protein
MQYALTSERQAPKGGTLVSGEDCVAFDLSGLKVTWSAEKSGYILTDGKTKVLDNSFGEADLEDTLKTVKTYGFGARCTIPSYWGTYDGYLEYWKKAPPVYTLGRVVPVAPAGILTTILRPKTPKAPPGDPLKEWVPVEFAPGPTSTPVSIRELSVAFGAKSPPSLVRLQAAPGKPVTFQMFVRGKDNALWVSKMDKDKWGAWESLGGVILSAPAAATWDGQTVVVVARGNDNAIWFRRYSKGAWEGWKSLGGLAKGDPAISSRWVDRYDVFTVGVDDAMWYQWFDGATLGTWQSLGNATTEKDEVGFKFGPASISMTTKAFYLFGVGINETLYMNLWKEGTWKGWHPLGGLGGVQSTPGIYRSSYGDPILLYRRTGGDFYGTVVKDEYHYVTRSLGTSMSGRPDAMVGKSPFEFDVYITLSDQKIWWRIFTERVFIE